MAKWLHDDEVARQLGEWWFDELSGRDGVEDCETDEERVAIANAALKRRGLNPVVTGVRVESEVDYFWLVKM